MHEVLHSVHKSSGHDELWKRYVNKVKEHYTYDGYEDYHLCPTPYSSNRKGNHTALPKKETEIKYIVECPICHTKWKYKRLVNIVKNPNAYWCMSCANQPRLIRTK